MKTNKRIIYENQQFPVRADNVDIEFRTPADGASDPGFAVHHRRDTYYMLTDNQLIKQRSFQIDGMKYIVNSCFELNAKRTVDDSVKYLIGLDMQKSTEKVS
jgi:hypothetical protein